jgi:hypothetical protein
VGRTFKLFLGAVGVVAAVLVSLVFWAKREAPKFEAMVKKAQELNLALKPFAAPITGDDKSFYDACVEKQRFDGSTAAKEAFCRCKTVNIREYVLPILPRPDKTMLERYKAINMNLSDVMTLVMAIDKGCFEAVKPPASAEPSPSSAK